MPERKLYYGSPVPGVVASQGSAAAAAGAVILDARTVFEQNAFGEPWTSFNHALGASADYVLAVVPVENAATITVTFGGVTMTVGPAVGPAASGSTFVRSFYLPSASLPAAGTKAVVVSPDNAFTAGIIGVWSLIGAAQTAPSRNDTHTSAGATVSAVSLASVPAGAFIASGHDINSGNISAMTGDGTQRMSVFVDGGGHACGLGDYFPTTLGTATQTWTNATNARVASLMVEILAA